MDWLIVHLIVGLLIAETCHSYRLKKQKGMARTTEQHRFAVSSYLILALAWELILVVAIVTGIMTKLKGQ